MNQDLKETEITTTNITFESKAPKQNENKKDFATVTITNNPQ